MLDGMLPYTGARESWETGEARDARVMSAAAFPSWRSMCRVVGPADVLGGLDAWLAPAGGALDLRGAIFWAQTGSCRVQPRPADVTGARKNEGKALIGRVRDME